MFSQILRLPSSLSDVSRFPRSYSDRRPTDWNALLPWVKWQIYLWLSIVRSVGVNVGTRLNNVRDKGIVVFRYLNAEMLHVVSLMVKSLLNNSHRSDVVSINGCFPKWRTNRTSRSLAGGIKGVTPTFFFILPSLLTGTVMRSSKAYVKMSYKACKKREPHKIEYVPSDVWKFKIRKNWTEPLVTSAWGTRISKQTISGSVVALWFRWVSDFDKEEEWVNYIKIYFRFFFSFLKPGLKVFQ